MSIGPGLSCFQLGFLLIIWTFENRKSAGPGWTLVMALATQIRSRCAQYMIPSKEDAYKYFDNNGIKFHFLHSVSIGVDFETLTPKFGQHHRLIIDSVFSHLSQEEFESLIIDYIFDTTGIKIETLKDIDKYSTNNNLPFIIQIFNAPSYNPVYTFAFGKINGRLIVSSDHIFESLGNIKEISDDLIFKGSNIKSLGSLQYMGGSLYIRQLDPPFTQLESLSNLEYVGGNLILKGAPLTDLGKLKHVNGNLNLRGTRIETLGQLEYVGGNLFLPNTMKAKGIPERLTVLGKVKYFLK